MKYCVKIKSKQAITLAEFSITMAIVLSIAAIGLLYYATVVTHAKQRTCNANVQNINAQWERFFLFEGRQKYPDLEELKASKVYFPRGAPVCPYATPYLDLDNNKRIDPHLH
ncbi:hypothetical protein ACFL52_00605 [Candidatus Margulisiibacteriota bacterium]